MLATLKALRLVIHLLLGVLLAGAICLDRNRLAPERLAQWWCSVLLEIFNIRLIVHGEPTAGARVSVANHVSWLDIPLIAACEPTRFISKSEVRHWPVAGWLADAAGTFYLRRGKGGAKPLLAKLVPYLRAGGPVVFFPEGTTSDGRRVLNFHPRLFAAAIEAHCPVQPIAVRYGRTESGGCIAPFIGDDDLVSHIWRLLQQHELVAEITYCPSIAATGYARDALALTARAAICAVVEPVQAEPGPEPVLAPIAV